MKEVRQMPLPVSRVTLSDLDNTLIDNRYQFTKPGITNAVDRAQQAGWRLGLSSDTPYRALDVWRDRLTMQGPIVAEKGAVVESAGKLIYDKSDKAAFALSREGIERELFDKGFVLWAGNPVEAIRSNQQIGNPGDRVALINSLRICSIGLFFRQVDASGRLLVDEQTTDLAMRELASLYPPFPIDEDFNQALGLVIVARAGTNKRSGTMTVMREEGLQEVGMLGDSMADFLGSDIARHYAVANGSEQYRQRADYVANGAITKGAIEILNKLP